MKKKFISLILALVVVLGLCAGITSISVIAKADAEISVKELFNATNTYDIDGEITKINDYVVYHDQMGYEKPQYSFGYKFSTKNSNTTTSAPHVTVFTHGYDSWGKDWCNNAETLPKGADDNLHDFDYSEHSMVHHVATDVYTNNAVVVRAVMNEKLGDSFGYQIDIEKEYSNNPSILEQNLNLGIDNINAIGNCHLIVVFDAFYTKSSNDNTYYQLNYMLSTILYKLKDNYMAEYLKLISLVIVVVVLQICSTHWITRTSLLILSV